MLCLSGGLVIRIHHEVAKVTKVTKEEESFSLGVLGDLVV